MTTHNIPVESEGKEINKKRKRMKPYIRRFLFKFLFVTFTAFIVFKFVYGIHVMHGNYMFPAIRDGDLLITYKLEEPLTTEVVAYNVDGRNYIGRIIARSGDVVEIGDSGELLVNGSRPAEEIFYPTISVQDSSIAYPYTVTQGCVFILNDYRMLDSPDSRVFGEISSKDLDGKMAFLLRRRGF